MSSSPSASPLSSILAALERVRKANLPTIESAAAELILDAADLDTAELLTVFATLRELGTTEAFRRQWRLAVEEKRRMLRSQADQVDAQILARYVEHDHCIFMVVPGRDGQAQEDLIARFTAHITAEIKDDDGERLFVLDGATAGGRPFTITLRVPDFCDENALHIAIMQAAGFSAVVPAGRLRHIVPAIQTLTTETPDQIYRYHRTGWAGENFLIQGMTSENVIVDLPEKLPYRVDANADVSLGLRALEALIHAQVVEKVLVALTVAFEAPLARLMSWRSERYGVLLTGPTGSFKTSVGSLIIALYGAGFQHEQHLIRLGPGSTVNAVITYATYASDLPMLIDNFKPNTGLGQRGLISLIHAIMEGGQKDRLDRNSELQAARAIHAWPLFTGEDTVATDPASLARLLVVDFKPLGPSENPALTEAQSLADHLNAVGRAWLEWLTTDDARAVTAQVKSQFPEARRAWLAYLKNGPQQSVNAARIATNLATNELAWRVLEQHPRLGEFARRYSVQHQAGLRAVADTMAALTSEALEARAFLDTLRELLASRRCYVLPAFGIPPDDARGGFIGWRGADGSFYLLPQLARQAVEAVPLAKIQLNQLSNNALYNQIAHLGLIQSCDRDSRHGKTIRDGQGKSQKVLHLSANAFGDV